jgi:hypothetical protein
MAQATSTSLTTINRPPPRPQTPRFGLHEAARVIFPVSRLVVDPERFRNDADEPMVARGMGAIYTRLSTGEPLRSLGETERRWLMETYYDPHHAKLENAVADALVRFGRCLIIDVHSFSSAPLPHEPDQTVPRPEVCIGFDKFHSLFDDAANFRRICEANQLAPASIGPLVGASYPADIGMLIGACARSCSKYDGTCTWTKQPDLSAPISPPSPDNFAH